MTHHVEKRHRKKHCESEKKHCESEKDCRRECEPCPPKVSCHYEKKKRCREVPYCKEEKQLVKTIKYEWRYRPVLRFRKEKVEDKVKIVKKVYPHLKCSESSSQSCSSSSSSSSSC